MTEKLTYSRQDELYAGHYGVTPREFESIKRQSQYRSIVHAFEQQVAINPDSIAIKDGDKTISYDELNTATNQLAHVIRQEISTMGEPLALLFEHGYESIIAMLAVLKSGNAYVPLDPNFPEKRLVSHLLDSEAKVLLTNAKNLRLGKKICGLGVKIINIENRRDGMTNVNLDIELSWDSPAAIYYTSGSTGEPKGILKDHGNYLTRPADYYPGDRQTHLFSYSFGASASNIFLPLISGATICPFDAKKRGIERLAHWLIKEEITFFQPPTSLLRRMLGNIEADVIFPKIRRVNLGGQATYKNDAVGILRHCSPTCIIRASYAASEAGVCAQFLINSKTVLEGEILPAGYVVPNMEILILDEQGKQLENNEVGEIGIRSRHNSQSYWKNPELMQEKYIFTAGDESSPIWLTGDLGSLHPDGLLEHRGRKDFQVKIRGYRVEVAEIEAKLEGREDIAQAAVVAAEYKTSGEKFLAAYVVAASNRKPSIRSLRENLKDTLPDYMIPARFIMLDKLPQTPLGKVDKNALPEPDKTRPGLDTVYLAPRNRLEKRLAAIWEEILEIDLAGIDDNFFELGGSSLQAMQLFVEIERMGGQKMPLSILLESSSVRQQAEILQKKGFNPNWSPVVAIQTLGSKPALFCLAGKGGNPLRFRQLANHLGEERPIYFLQSRGLNGIEKPYVNVEDIATDFLTEIQKVQSSGPYYLCGSSFGGLVAYEIAQQLLVQGERVDLLSLLDTYSPGYLAKKRKNSFVKRIATRIYEYSRKQISTLITSDREAQRANLGYYREAMPQLIAGFKNRISMTLENLSYRSLPPELREVEAANVKASRKYQPRGYPGKVVLLRATRIPIDLPLDQELGWGDVDIGELVIHNIDSYHGNILFEPAVNKVAEVLLVYLGGK